MNVIYLKEQKHENSSQTEPVGGDIDAGVNFVTESDTTVVNAVLDMRVLYSESSCFRIVSDLHANQLPNLQPHIVEDAAIATQNKHGGGGVVVVGVGIKLNTRTVAKGKIRCTSKDAIFK